MNLQKHPKQVSKATGQTETVLFVSSRVPKQTLSKTEGCISQKIIFILEVQQECNVGECHLSNDKLLLYGLT